MNRYVYAIVKRIRGLITIDSINGGLPLTYEGLFEDGMWYFADTTGTKVVDQNDPDRSEWFIGTGNADGDIDLDIKMLAITDVVVPETVQLGVAFDVSGNYVMLEDKIVIEGYNDDSSTWVKLHAGDYIDVTGGSFTETVTIESADGFTVNTTVTVRVRSYDGYALNGSDSTDVIATVTMNAISGVVDGTPYTLEGGTDGDAVEIWVDDGTGYAYEGDAVVVGSAWTYDITLSAGTYGVKAIDGTDSRGYSEQTGVEVASGVVALQFGSNGEDWLTDIIEDGDDLIVAGITNGTTMFGVSTGASTNVHMGFLNKIDKDGNTVAGFTPRFWKSQDSGTTLSVIQSRQITVMGDYIYNIRTPTSGNIEKRSKSSGALISNAYLKVEGTRRSIINDGTNIYICGNDTNDVYNPATIFKITDALAITQYKNDSFRYYLDLDFNGTDLIVSQYGGPVKRVNTSGVVQATTGIGYISYMNRHITATANRSYTFNQSDTGWGVHAMSNSTLAKLFSVDMGFSNYPACCRKQSNGNIGFVCRNESDTVTVTFFSDADAYSEIAKKVITAHSGTIRLTTSHCPIISEGGYVGGSIDGKITADATHVSGHDCFIVKAR